MINEIQNNKVTVWGSVHSSPTFSHEIYGESFYEFNLKVQRLSETYDIIPVTISDHLMHDVSFELGTEIGIIGQFRSYNKVIDGKSKLMLTVFALEIVDSSKIDNPNTIEITGFICKQPIYRVTPFKREICDLLLAVNRSYNKSDYLPCIAWGRNARYIRNFAIGDKVSIVGRVQSREYTKKLDNGESITKVAYEVSLSKITTESNGQLTTYDADQIAI